MLSGFKTYLAAFFGIVWAGYGLYSGHLTPDAASQIIETALVGTGLRAAIAKQ